jgi:hypothetical protein
MTAVGLPWRVVARDHRFAYVVVLAAANPRVCRFRLDLGSTLALEATPALEQVERPEELISTYWLDLVPTPERHAGQPMNRGGRRLRGWLEEDHLFAARLGPLRRVHGAAWRRPQAGRTINRLARRTSRPPCWPTRRPCVAGKTGSFMTPGNMWDLEVVLFAFALFSP